MNNNTNDLFESTYLTPPHKIFLLSGLLVLFVACSIIPLHAAYVQGPSLLDQYRKLAAEVKILKERIAELEAKFKEISPELDASKKKADQRMDQISVNVGKSARQYRDHGTK